MTEAAKQARREYKKRWRETHPDAVKRHQSDFWERQAAKAAGGNIENKPKEKIIPINRK